MAINDMLKLLENLENNTKNWRLSSKNYNKEDMKKLLKYASKIEGEKVTLNDIQKNFKTFHSATKYYKNIEKKLVENKATFIENYEYNLKFLIKLTNDNLTRIRKAKRGGNPSINEMYTIVSNFLTNARDFKRAVLNEKDVFMGIDTDIKEFSVNTIVLLYNQIIQNYPDSRITSIKQLQDYYTNQAIIDEKKSIENTIKQRRGLTKQKLNWNELKEINEDDYHFIDALLDVTVEMVTRDGKQIQAPFRLLAKRSIDIFLFWELVDAYRATIKDIAALSYTDYVALFNYIVSRLGVFGFSSYMLQNMYLNNVITIKAIYGTALTIKK